MCANLPQFLQHSGALAHTLVATHVPPSKPGGTRFFARYVSFERGRVKPFGMVLSLVRPREGCSSHTLSAVRIIDAEVSALQGLGGDLRLRLRIAARRLPPAAMKRTLFSALAAPPH